MSVLFLKSVALDSIIHPGKKERRPHKAAATKDASKSLFDIFDAFFADELTLVFDDVRRVGAEHARRLIL